MILVDQNFVPLNRFKSSPANISYYHKPEFTSVSAARNFAASCASGEWLIFCDDDGYLEENYLVRFNDYLENRPSVKMIAGSIVRDDGLGFYSIRHKIGGNFSSIFNVKLLMGSNFCIRKNVFFDLGQFDELFGAGSFWGSGEETDLAIKAYFSNIERVYVPELQVLHVKPYGMGFVNSMYKAFFYGLGKGALVQKWLVLNLKPILMVEFLEMQIVPLIKIFFSLIKLRVDNSLIHFCSLIGRYLGFFSSCLFSFFRQGVRLLSPNGYFRKNATLNKHSH